LDQLQRRLAQVRSALQSLQVEELRVSSPSTWQRPAESNRPATVQATLQVNGALAPAQLQALIRTVGALPGVRLAPVVTEANRSEDGRVRLELLRSAYDDALRQAQPLADLVGRPRLRPLEIRVDGMEMPAYAMRAVAADAVAPFNPDELSKPRDRMALQVRFCAE
ncbi:MAG: SIMPL domain-containing protein, partial [Cyanobium sp.]